MDSFAAQAHSCNFSLRSKRFCLEDFCFGHARNLESQKMKEGGVRDGEKMLVDKPLDCEQSLIFLCKVTARET